jgi:hypothetical protein
MAVYRVSIYQSPRGDYIPQFKRLRRTRARRLVFLHYTFLSDMALDPEHKTRVHANGPKTALD